MYTCHKDLEQGLSYLDDFPPFSLNFEQLPLFLKKAQLLKFIIFLRTIPS
jgi:hypothetical protein